MGSSKAAKCSAESAATIGIAGGHAQREHRLDPIAGRNHVGGAAETLPAAVAAWRLPRGR